MQPLAAAVVRRGGIGEYAVVADVVANHAIAEDGHMDNGRSRVTQIREDGLNRDVEHIVAKAPTVGPAARDSVDTEEARLHRARQYVAPEDA